MENDPQEVSGVLPVGPLVVVGGGALFRPPACLYQLLTGPCAACGHGVAGPPSPCHTACAEFEQPEQGLGELASLCPRPRGLGS